MRKEDIAQWDCHTRLEKFHDGEFEPYEVRDIEGNCMLNTGIDEIWDLVTGSVSQTNRVFNGTNAQIGVGEGTAAASGTQTDLQGTSTTYKAMESGYPTSTAQAVTFKSSFGGTDANYAWNEWVVKSVAGTPTNICLNRKVEALGTKSSGTWTLEVSITLS